MDQSRHEPVLIGQAGWALSKATSTEFAGNGTHLERYARRFCAVEINSTFYRSHKTGTYARWAASVPPNFKFSVKVPKTITHINPFADLAALDRFLDEIRPLNGKLGPLLLQTPPALAFDPPQVGRFLRALKSNHAGDVVCEARHQTWFGVEASTMLTEFGIGRVNADPTRGLVSKYEDPNPSIAYFRLHGSPRVYYSSYSRNFLETLARDLANASRSRPVWCIFDNTASGAALPNALQLLDLVNGSPAKT